MLRAFYALEIFGGMISPCETSHRLEPSPTNSLSLAEVGSLLVLELDGGRVYLNDGGELFALPEHAAIRDRLVDALNASGARPGSPPLPLLYAMRMAETAIAYLGRGRIVNPRSTPPAIGTCPQARTPNPQTVAARRGRSLGLPAGRLPESLTALNTLPAPSPTTSP